MQFFDDAQKEFMLEDFVKMRLMETLEVEKISIF